ncbi:hypothetical protein [Myxococcus sp. RHSTA-1-4]|uniref:hypothetical protein n=1 Tax=Myxococcus sp. RHSTA-1-4 TaxID=2874601 RepID=UPI001CBEDA93|nr:hypothetical protein [Myxococcus sp. RHSTA-1-4]MBZ4421854.1 hypothetical protein [Myxococcus sp. RHSTA-1-4]
MTNVVETFAERYYRWAREEMARELAGGLDRARRVKGADAARAVVLLDSLAPDERTRLATALLKQAHAPAAGRLGEGPTPEETALARRFNDRKMLLQAPLELRPGAGTLKRPELRKVLKATLNPLLGKPQSVFGGREEWRYTRQVGRWLVHTHVDTGGSIRQADYSHEIVPAGAEGQLPLARAISLMTWLGLSGTTSWNVLAEGEAEEAAQAMASFCEHFLQAAPALLDGL